MKGKQSAGFDLMLNSFTCAPGSLETVVEAQVQAISGVIGCCMAV